MKYKNEKTENSETKREAREEATDTSNDINKEAVKNQTGRDTGKEIKRDMNTVTNTEMNKEIKSDVKNTNSPELDSFIKNLHYPAKKQDILDMAMREGNDTKITSTLQMIPEKYYSSAAELNRELAAME